MVIKRYFGKCLALNLFPYLPIFILFCYEYSMNKVLLVHKVFKESFRLLFIYSKFTKKDKMLIVPKVDKVIMSVTRALFLQAT